jgi:hypothetical protein
MESQLGQGLPGFTPSDRESNSQSKNQIRQGLGSISRRVPVDGNSNHTMETFAAGTPAEAGSGPTRQKARLQMQVVFPEKIYYF